LTRKILKESALAHQIAIASHLNSLISPIRKFTYMEKAMDLLSLRPINFLFQISSSLIANKDVSIRSSTDFYCSWFFPTWILIRILLPVWTVSQLL